MAAPVRKPTPKANQNDLRRLMKEKQRQKGGSKRIESPLAKYNNLDQLFCILCNTQIKNDLVWPAHVSGRLHKENLDILKNKKQQAEDSSKFKQPLPPPPAPPPPPAKPVKSILKRKAESSESNAGVSNDKRAKGDQTLPADFFDEASSASGASVSFGADAAATSDPSAAPSSSLLTMCERDEENGDAVMDESPSSPDDATKLPADFFDEDEAGMSQEGDDAANRLNSVEALPEGFFDDPIVDAKVRKVEYQDPVEIEWEKFQREIADATTKAQAIIDEEEEESTAERQIDEIEEQIRNWARVDVLQRRKEELDVRNKDANGKNFNDDDDNVDEQEFDEFLDWRAKDSWR